MLKDWWKSIDFIWQQWATLILTTVPIDYNIDDDIDHVNIDHVDIDHNDIDLADIDCVNIGYVNIDHKIPIEHGFDWLRSGLTTIPINHLIDRCSDWPRFWLVTLILTTVLIDYSPDWLSSRLITPFFLHIKVYNSTRVCNFPPILIGAFSTKQG